MLLGERLRECPTNSATASRSAFPETPRGAAPTMPRSRVMARRASASVRERGLRHLHLAHRPGHLRQGDRRKPQAERANDRDAGVSRVGGSGHHSARPAGYGGGFHRQDSDLAGVYQAGPELGGVGTLGSRQWEKAPARSLRYARDDTRTRLPAACSLLFVSGHGTKPSHSRTRTGSASPVCHYPTLCDSGV